MSKTLIRGVEVPHNAKVLNTSEFIDVALEQISSTALTIKDLDETEPVLTAMSDILDLMCSLLKAKNIEPTVLFGHAEVLRETKGTFEKKVAVTKE